MVDRESVFGIVRKKEFKSILVLALAVFFAILGDVYTTTYIIKNGGIELNPVVNLLYGNLNFVTVDLWAQNSLTLALIILFGLPLLFLAIEDLKGELSEIEQRIAQFLLKTAKCTVAFVGIVRGLCTVNNLLVLMLLYSILVMPVSAQGETATTTTLELVVYLILMFVIATVALVSRRLTVSGIAVMLLIAIASIVKIDVVVIFAIIFTFVISLQIYFYWR